MKLDPGILIGAIKQEIEKYPLHPHEASLFLRGLERAVEIIEVTEARYTHMERLVAGRIALSERKDDPKPLHADPGNWLYLPGDRSFISVKDIRSIGLTVDEGRIVIHWNSGGDSAYYGADKDAIWSYAERNRVDSD